MKKGFTLIELLAVIVILAIISIIAVPIVLNIINDTKESSILRSADFYLDAVENSIATATLKNIQIQNGTYQVMNDGNVCIGTLDNNVCSGEILEVEIDGEKPSSGSITIENGKLINPNLIISNKEVWINPDTGKLEYKESSEIDTPEVVLDPGLYDKNNKLLASWDELVEEYDFYNALINGNNAAGDIIDSIVGASNLVLDNSVTSIGEGAFNGCTSLERVTLSNSLTGIGTGAFDGCTKLTRVIIPESVTIISNYAFRDCTSLKEITLPSALTDIGEYAFYGCTSLENITIPSTVINMGDYVFYGCTSLKTVVIEEGVTTLGGFHMFAGCTSLENVIIPNSVTTIYPYAFANTGLTSIKLPGSLTLTGFSSFSNCTNLKTVIIEEGVVEIPDGLFANTGLTSITIPSSVRSFGYSAFEGCTNLESIKVDSNNPVYDSRNNSNAIIETATGKLIAGSKNTVIPNGVTSIGSGAFSGISIENITIPSSVTNIEIGAFQHCSNLTNIKVDSNNPVYDSRNNSNAIIETATNTLLVGSKNTVIPNNVTGIVVLAFAGNKRLESITIPSSVTFIGADAFIGSSMKNITILNPDVEICGEIFSNCTSLTTIYYKGSTTGYPWGAPNNPKIETNF